LKTGKTYRKSLSGIDGEVVVDIERESTAAVCLYLVHTLTDDEMEQWWPNRPNR